MKKCQESAPDRKEAVLPWINEANLANYILSRFPGKQGVFELYEVDREIFKIVSICLVFYQIAPKKKIFTAENYFQ